MCDYYEIEVGPGGTVGTRKVKDELGSEPIVYRVEPYQGFPEIEQRTRRNSGDLNDKETGFGVPNE